MMSEKMIDLSDIKDIDIESIEEFDVKDCEIHKIEDFKEADNVIPFDPD